MDITFEQFQHSCPASAMPDNSIFESISGYVDFARVEAVGILTLEIFDRLDTVEPSDPDYDVLQQLSRDTVSYICSSAFWAAVPQLDLVLTSTGFGVVSNQNVAPASYSRVEALRTALRLNLLARLDSMISTLRSLEQWHDSAPCREYFRTLFWRSDQIRIVAGPLATRDDLTSNMPRIANAELQVAQIISPEQLALLRRLEATDKATPIQSMAIQHCRSFVVACLCDPNAIELHRRILLGFVESHPDEFAIYHSSQTYKANHFEPYRNEKDDSCFFFG